MDLSLVRSVSTVLEVLHGEIYSAPEAKQIYADAGLKGGWMGYMAFRLAPLGPVAPETATAVMYNFHERLVRRSIPDAWSYASPDAVLRARATLGDVAIGRALARAAAEDVEEAATLAEDAARAAMPSGRVLFAANAALPWPDDPPSRLWHAATLLREHRGDGHNAVLLSEGVDGCECHLLAAAAGQVHDEDQQREHRGYTVEEWDAARARLQTRGLLDEHARFTESGRALKQRIEDRTDALAAQPFDAIGDQASRRLVELSHQIAPGLAHLMD